MKGKQGTGGGGGKASHGICGCKEGNEDSCMEDSGRQQEDSRKTAGRQDREAGGDVPDVLLRLLRCLTVIYMCVCVRGANGEGARHIGDARGGAGNPRRLSVSSGCPQGGVQPLLVAQVTGEGISTRAQQWRCTDASMLLYLTGIVTVNPCPLGSPEGPFPGAASAFASCSASAGIAPHSVGSLTTMPLPWSRRIL